MNADEKKLVRIAKRHGATVEANTKHFVVKDGDEVVFTLSLGTHKRGDESLMRSVWRRRGWL